MTMQPLARTFEAVVPAVGAGADDTTTVCEAPYDGTVQSVEYLPKAAITGANTDSRTVSLINKGQSGSGTTAPALRAFTNGVNAAAFDNKVVPLSGTAADLAVVAGDVLAWKSLHVGSTGLADPGGTVIVTLARG
jgi:hypothetical protein